MAATALWGCGGGQQQQETLQLGTLLSTTGALGAVGVGQLEAAELAVAEINAAGGVLGRPLTLLKKDDATDAARAREGAEALVAAGVPVVFGAIASSSTLSAAEVLAPAGVVQLSSSSTSPALTDFEDSGYLFRTCPSDAFQGKLLATRALSAGKTQAAVIHIAGAYGEGLTGAFTSAYQAGGGTVVKTAVLPEGEAGYQSLLDEVFGANPQAVLVVAYPADAATLVKDYKTYFSDRSVSFLFTEAVSSPEFVEAAGASSFTFEHEGTVVAKPGGARYEAFTTAYQAKYGRTPEVGFYGGQLYDAVYLAALAIEQAGSTEAQAIRDALPLVSSGGEAFGPGQFAAAVAAIKAGTDINFEGATGPVDFDAQGDVSAPFDIWEVQDGSITVTVENQSP